MWMHEHDRAVETVMVAKIEVNSVHAPEKPPSKLPVELTSGPKLLSLLMHDEVKPDEG
jgi:hypothetical protein